MEFINRETELLLLGETRERSLRSAQMTVIVGRRRIGKTSLAIKASENNLFLYFFIARKNEALLCQDFLDEIGHKLKNSCILIPQYSVICKTCGIVIRRLQS
jgi:AAA+ ATPase superfamily predicted ATPase